MGLYVCLALFVIAFMGWVYLGAFLSYRLAMGIPFSLKWWDFMHHHARSTFVIGLPVYMGGALGRKLAERAKRRAS
jgi:hypothetical protein